MFAVVACNEVVFPDDASTMIDRMMLRSLCVAGGVIALELGSTHCSTRDVDSISDAFQA